MRDVQIEVKKAPPPPKIPHESDALMQLHVVVVPLFLVAYYNKPLLIVIGKGLARKSNKPKSS